MASVVVVATGAALAVTVPFIALKEIFEKRARSNLKKHLGAGGKRHKCRVNFGSVDNIEIYTKSADFHQKGYHSDDEDRSSVISLPPNYDDLFHPPPYDSKTM